MDLFIDNYDDWIGIAASYVGDDLAPDMVQECYLKLHNLVKNEGKTLSRGYIFLTIRSMCFDFLREKQKVKKVDIFDLKYSDEVDEKQAYENLVDKINKEIESWYWYDRDLFKLYKDTDMSYRQMDEEIGISWVSIYNTVSDCKKKIKDKFQKDYDNYKQENYELL